MADLLKNEVFHYVTVDGVTSPISGVVTFGGTFAREKKDVLPVPAHIYINEDLGEVTGVWEDGVQIKLTCSVDDTFTLDDAVAYLTMYKVFGGKTQFKKHWMNRIHSKITWLSEGPAKTAELERLAKLEQDKKKKSEKKAARLLESRKKELEELIASTSPKTKKK